MKVDAPEGRRRALEYLKDGKARKSPEQRNAHRVYEAVQGIKERTVSSENSVIIQNATATATRGRWYAAERS